MTHKMPRGGTCGRPDDHRGQHRSAEALENERERQREDSRPEIRERKRKNNRERRRDGRYAKMLAAQLARGKRIAIATAHHKGMAELKAQLGQPRPAGLELSLVDFWGSATAYWGYKHYRGARVPYPLDTDPENYCWETREQNLARGFPTRDLREG
jgi:hypothetical protein